jgi:hypothetical protein
MLKKAQSYAEEIYPSKITKGRDKPTMHKLMFKNGTGILCYAAGEEGDSTRGYTLKKLMVDEGSRMDELYFISAIPTLSVSHGSIDIASTPTGTKTKHGEEKFFYKCSKDDKFKKFFATAEECPRHDKEFLKRQKEKLTKAAYAQEYLAQFLEFVERVFDENLIKKTCILKRRPNQFLYRDYYLGCDVGGWGGDPNTFEILDGTKRDHIEQVENIVKQRNYTTETSDKIISLNSQFNFRGIGIDDGGVGFGVFSELMNNNQTKRKTIALNNSSRDTDSTGERSKKLLKQEMYINLLTYMEKDKIKLLDDDEIKESLSSISHDEEDNIFSLNSHITEGIIRSLWLIAKRRYKPKII